MNTVTELTLMTPGVYRLRLPLSPPLNHVNCYLFQGEDGWDIVDAGLADQETDKRWQATLRELAIEPDRVRRIYVTHYHSDHFGFSGRLQSNTGAPVCMLEAEIASAGRVGQGVWEFRRDLEQLYRMHGMPEALVAQIMESLGAPREAADVPSVICTLHDGDVVQLGDLPYQVLWSPGHSDGQFCLYGLTSKILVAADHVLPHISPNVSVAPGGRPNPLGDYLEALDRVAALDVIVGLPGHGDPFGDVKGRIAELKAHHEKRIARMAEACGPVNTGYEISRAVFPWVTSSSQQRGALTETLAHLELLVSRGRLYRREGHPVTYVRSKPL